MRTMDNFRRLPYFFTSSSNVVVSRYEVENSREGSHRESRAGVLSGVSFAFTAQDLSTHHAERVNSQDCIETRLWSELNCRSRHDQAAFRVKGVVGALELGFLSGTARYAAPIRANGGLD